MSIFRRRSGPSSSPKPRGQALVEFALAIPLFLLLLVGIFDLGRAVFAYNTLTNAAREGARLAIVNQDEASIIQHAKNSSAIVELNAPNVDVDFWQVNNDGTADTSTACNLVANGCVAIISFEATYHPITPLIGNIVFGNGVTFKATSTLLVEYFCPNATFPDPNNCPKQP